MIHSLRKGERSIGELAQPFDMSLAGASKHVQVLERAGLIRRRKEGRTYYCAINIDVFHAAYQWFEQYSEFWNSRLNKLNELLENEKGETDDK